MNDMTPPPGGGMLPDSPSGPPPGPPPAAPARRAQPVYDGQAGDLAKISISNALLTLATLGIYRYRFWGKTRIRRYFWSHLSFLDDRLEYSGTAKELLIGFLVAIAILAPIFVSFHFLELWAGLDEGALGLVGLVELLVIFTLIHLAIFRARRYRLTRSQWRGIRGGQTGSSFKYAAMAMGWSLVSALTLGLAYPLYRVRLQRYLMENTWFGDRTFSFKGRAAELLGPWLLTWLFYLPTLGFIYLWYKVRELRYFVSQTEYGRLSFRSDLSAGSVFVVYLFYGLAMMFVIGAMAALATGLVPGLSEAYMDMAGGDSEAMLANEPLINLFLVAVMAVVVVTFSVIQVLFFLHPMFRVVAHSLNVIGEEDFSAIAQNQQSLPGRGEGLADTLDVGAF
jgi:uncharacterized membrane protein YjgN (DUF898 family)